MTKKIEKDQKQKKNRYGLALLFFVVFFLLFSLFCNFRAIVEGRILQDITENPQNFIYLELSLFLLLVVGFGYFHYENPKILESPRSSLMVLGILLVSFLVSYGVGMYHCYARPVALAALLALALLGRKDAVILHILSCLLLFLSDTFSGAEDRELYASIIVCFVTGMIGIFLASGIRNRIKTILVGLVLALPTIVTVFLQDGYSLDSLWHGFLYGVTAGLGSVVAYTALLPIFESIFNIVTNYRLYEITDHHAPLLKRLIEEAPGTFNHSIVVATLAEACAAAIGENPELARACAYYHDVGKLTRPEFFKENQKGENPHDSISPELSADIIRQHAKIGKDLIKKARLPAILGEVAEQHHGTLPIRYFYEKAKTLTEGEPDIKRYSYYGPTPKTKVAVIVMLCDSAEAVSRTLSDRSRETVSAAVQKIIDERMYYRQFDDAPITLEDLTKIKETLVSSISAVFHERILYPEATPKKTQAPEEKTEETPVSASEKQGSSEEENK